MLPQSARSAGAADNIHSRAYKKQPGRQQLERKLAATLWWFTAAPKTLKYKFFGVTQPPGVVQPLYSRGHN